MQRRRLLRAGLGLCAFSPVLTSLSALAHTPYSQWQVYRKKHLLIGCHREDLQTWDLAQQMVETLQSHLPAAKARVARAPHPQRLASLLGTEQLQFAIVDVADAKDMIPGNGRFKPYGVLPLQVLWQTGSYLLLVRSDVPIRHGWLVAQALDDAEFAFTAREVSSVEQPLSSEFSWHTGATLYRSGEPAPE